MDVERLRGLITAAPQLSMVRADAGCRAVNRGHVAAAGVLAPLEIADSEEILESVGGRIDRRPAPVSRGLGRRGKVANDPIVIWHVPTRWLESEES